MRSSLIVLCVAALLGGCGGPTGVKITKAEFESTGRRWPLIPISGYIGCDQSVFRWFRTEDGARYALNGTARSNDSYKEIEPIWLYDTKLNDEMKKVGADGPWVRVNIGDLIEEAGKYC